MVKSGSIPNHLVFNSTCSIKEGEETFSCTLRDRGDEGYSNCYGYKYNIGKTILFYTVSVLTGGLMSLISYWKPEWKLKFTHTICHLDKADTVLIIDQYQIVYVEKVQVSCKQVTTDYVDSPVYLSFWYKHLKYYYDCKENMFVHLEGISPNETYYDITHRYNGIFSNEREQWLLWYGSNNIDIKMKSYWKLFVEESANPFYIFQACSCALWFWDGYTYYAIVILVITVGSIVISMVQTRKHLKSLRNMIAKSGLQLVLLPDGKLEEIDSVKIVPGDVIVIPKNGGMMHCDAVLVTGTVIVNESTLTGESLPVMKTTVPRPTHHADGNNHVFDSVRDKRHTLYAGTEILQTRYYANEHVLAVVVKTGFSTTKGNLLRSILFPKPIGFQFFKDAMKFIAVLGGFALIGLIYTIYVLKKSGGTTSDIIDKALDVITIAVPPSLPAAMCVGTIYALQRLNKSDIFCISPSRVNISGKIKLFCFDKTGTLTEDGLDFCGLLRSPDLNCFFDQKKLLDIPQTDHIIVAMATCHSLTIIDGNITGDPIDLKMFSATGWQMEEVGPEEAERYGMIIPLIVKPKESSPDDVIGVKYLSEAMLPLEVAIMRQFPFSSELQRMSVVVRRLGLRHMDVYAKGSPEMIATLCDPSTIPHDFDDSLGFYTKNGYRVLALAYKSLDSKVSWHKIQQFDRSKIECDLKFLGFIVTKNVLKPETTAIIRELYQAKIRIVMVTGDNMLTAACVARECGMVTPSEKIVQITLGRDNEINYSTLGEMEDCNDRYSSSGCDLDDSNFLNRSFHFAVTGKVFAVIQNRYPNLYSRLLVCGTVFCRMLPDQKTSLIEGLQSIGYFVGMCGDGANDCGALKRAHVGISLSELEASVASPFTSKNPNISCVVQVIKEGRCALVTSFNIFKFMASYSMIQYVTALMLYHIFSNIGEFQYLYIDLFIITPIAVTMSRTGPANQLVPKRPRGRLMHPYVMTSIILQTITQIAFQTSVFLIFKTIPGYKPIDYFKPDHPPTSDYTQILCYENTILFTYANFQYIIVAIVYSVGRPYRQKMYKNVLFLITVVGLTIFNVLLVIKPNHQLQKVFEVLSVNDIHYYLVFFTLVLFNLLISYFIDHVFIELPWIQKCLKILQGKKRPKNEYKIVLKQLHDDH